MELSYDWSGFQRMFNSRGRANAVAAEGVRPIYAVVDRGVVLGAFSEAEDLTEWSGTTFEELQTGLSNREIITLERERADAWIEGAIELPHLYDQVDYMRTSAAPGKSGFKLIGQKHFFLQSLGGWWGKVLPSAYGMLVRLEGNPSKEHLLIIKRGRLEAFFEPDLTNLGAERRNQPADVVKHLSEKYGVPVQGVFLSESEWEQWAQSPHPWRLVAKAVRSGRAKMIPFRWGLATMMATRAFFDI